MTRPPAVLPTQVGAPLPGNGVVVVRGAARLLGVCADALITLEDAEHRRRVGVGLAAVEGVEVLDALMCLPVGQPVPIVDLDDATRRTLRTAPSASVEWGDDAVARLLTPACSVDHVIVRAARWRSGLRHAAAFAPFAAATVALDGDPPPGADWEADAAGIGLRTSDGDGVARDLVLPAPFVPRYVKPVAWAFRERAYATWRRCGTRTQDRDGSARHH